MKRDFSFPRGIPALNLDKPCDIFIRTATSDIHELVYQVVFHTLVWTYIAAEFSDDNDATVYLNNLAEKFMADRNAERGGRSNGTVQNQRI